MDKIKSKILLYFQEVLTGLNTESHKGDPLIGIPPLFMIVDQIEFSTYDSSERGDCLGRWIVHLTSIEEFSGDPKAIKLEENGMYYSHGFGDFSIHNNGEVVRIGWHVGPRFGRGYKYSIAQSNDEIDLVHQEDLWMS